MNDWSFTDKQAYTAGMFLKIRDFTYNWINNVKMHTISYVNG
jgi:hypothetical protein